MTRGSEIEDRSSEIVGREDDAVGGGRLGVCVVGGAGGRAGKAGEANGKS